MARVIDSSGSIQAREVVINSTLKNTYLLLAMTLLFSAAMAGLSMAMGWPHPGIILTLVGYFGLLFLTSKFQNSAWGLLFVFALTGFMGITLGPIISAYVNMLPNGSSVVMTAMGGTGLVFVGLSAFAIISRKNFSFMGGMLAAGILVAFLLGLGAIFFKLPMLSLAVSAMFILLMSALILYQTSEIVHGGETNYINATVTLFVALFNLFTSLLHILGIFGDE